MSIEITLDVRCSQCGKKLDATVTHKRTTDPIDPAWQILEVEPCQDCLDAAYQDGTKEGKSK